MPNLNHHWTTFEKGKLKIKACGHCGQMCLPSNTNSECDKQNILLSPVVRAGYKLSYEATDEAGRQFKVA